MRWKTVSEDDSVPDGSEIRQQAQKWRGVRNISEVKKEQNSIIITWSFLVTWRRQHLMNCKLRLWSQIYLDTKSTWPVTGFCHWQSYLAFLSLNFLPCRTVVKIPKYAKPLEKCLPSKKYRINSRYYWDYLAKQAFVHIVPMA